MSPLRFILSSLPKRHPNSLHHHRRTFIDGTAVKYVRDRGLDHAVEREKNLKPLINIKNLIKSEPSKSLPLSIIAENRTSLNIPTRPIEFLRKFPSVFQEFLPGGAGFQPHFRLTPEALDLDAEEQVMYQSESYKHQAADRLLKLLMLCRANKLPLTLVERLKWDLGLPQDYQKSVVPEFPDYFRIRVAKDCSPGQVLELVCWISEMGTSALERKAMANGDSKGMPIAFPMQFSRGFEMDKKMKKWVEDWQKLPYVSPYENAGHLAPQSEESDKWAVAVLHEFLHILVPKKTERENVLCLGEYLGLRSRFKRALLHHPGIFYLSSKIETYTVVLKEGYKRGLLIENQPLMNMRSKYIHLMNTMKEDSKSISVSPGGSGSTQKQKQTISDSKGEKDEEEEGSEDENVREMYDSSDAEEDEDDPQQGVEEDVVINRGRTRKTNSDVKGRVRNPERRSGGTRSGKTREEFSPEISLRTEKQGGSSRRRPNLDRNPERSRSDGTYSGKAREKFSPEISLRTEKQGGSSRRRPNLDRNPERSRSDGTYSRTVKQVRSSRRRPNLDRNPERSRSDGTYSGKTRDKFSPGVSSRTDKQGRSSRGRPSLAKSRGRSMPNKTPS